MADRVSTAFVLALMLTAATACGGASPPTPTVPAGGAETITGNERLGWDQLSDDAAELAAIGWAVYVDGARVLLPDVSCSNTAVSGRFPCTSRLPALAAGTHTLQIVSFFESDPSVESARSTPLQVVVRSAAAAVAAAPAAAAPWQSGSVAASDGGRMRLERLMDGLIEPTDAAFAPDGRLFVAERRGVVGVFEGAPLRAVERSRLENVQTDGRNGLLAMALDPDFERTHVVFAVYTAPGRSGRAVFRLARFREVQGRLGERAILLDGITASPDRPAAALRFGPDGLIYLALDDGGDPGAPADPASLNGKVLRVQRDGRTPGDRQLAGPVFWSGVHSPRGLAFDSATIWLSDAESPRTSRLTAIAVEPGPPPRTIAIVSDELSGDVAGSLASLDAAVRTRSREALWMGSAEGQFIVRISPRPGGARQIEARDVLLSHHVGPIRVVFAGPGGALYFCTDTTVGRLVPE